MENKSLRDEINVVTKKVLCILGLVLALLLPLNQVENQIQGRKEHEMVAQKEVAKGWGENVHFRSPWISLAEGNLYPSVSETKIAITSQEKKKGVFHVPVYEASVKFKVSFQKPSDFKKGTQGYMLVPIAPVTSIQSFQIKNPGSGQEWKAKLAEEGLRLALDESAYHTLFSNPVEIEFSIRGTGPLSYSSNSDSEAVGMQGNWTKPKFLEENLPLESKLSSKGFEATWKLNSLPRWQDDSSDHSRQVRLIGLDHLWIGTEYSKVEKSVKYGVLFITLTFFLVFFIEFLSKAKIHPLQYGFIGLSISVFYLLLLALSESLGFEPAYVLSSVAVTCLIVFYVGGFLHQKKFVKMILVEQMVLSAFFYSLLILEEKAFLVGSLGLFAALATFMALTRRFDWYSGSFRDPAKTQMEKQA